MLVKKIKNVATALLLAAMIGGGVVLLAAMIGGGVGLVIANPNDKGGNERDEQPDCAPQAPVNETKGADPRTFVKQQGFEGMPYAEAKARFTKKDTLHILYLLLDDPEYAPHWGRVANLIGYLGSEPASAPVLLKYFERSDDQHWRLLERTPGYKTVLQKIEALRWLGLVGGKEVSVLRDALTERGAAALAKKWIESPLLAKFGMDRERVIALIRGRAAMGIVYSQKADDIVLVERAYLLEHDHCRKNKASTKFYNEVVSAIATRDLIAARGLEGYLQLQGTGKSHQAIVPYIHKYSWRYENGATGEPR